MKPEWDNIALDVTGFTLYWCRGCGCLKIVTPGKPTRYRVPRREKERRVRK